MIRDKFEERLIAVNNYTQSVNTTLTFIHIYLWDNEKKQNRNINYDLGKKLLTQKDEYTPDILLQLNSNIGIIVELKKSLPKNTSEIDKWKGDFLQLKNYDQELIGWFTENQKIDEQDLMLLVDESFAVPIEDYIKRENLNFNTYSKNFAIIEFGNRTQDIFPATFFRKRSEGNIRAFNGVDELFRIGRPISWRFLESSNLAQIKFTDSKPPIEYLMETIWLDLGETLPIEFFNEIKKEGEKKVISIHVSVSNLTDRILHTYMKSEAKKAINDDLVREALDNFVKINFAEKVDNDIYLIKWKTTKIRYDGEVEPLRIFAKKLIAYEEEEEEKKKPKDSTLDDFLPGKQKSQ